MSNLSVVLSISVADHGIYLLPRRGIILKSKLQVLILILLHTLIAFVCDDGRSFANRQEKAKQTYDLVLSNPPFGPLSKKKKKYRKAGNVFTTSKRYEAELLWANLKLMHTDSFLIIILPSTYMNGSSYIECRKWLARNYNIHAIVKLPSNTFEKATLNTVAIILQKVEPCATYVYNTATSV